MNTYNPALAASPWPIGMQESYLPFNMWNSPLDSNLHVGQTAADSPLNVMPGDMDPCSKGVAGSQGQGYMHSPSPPFEHNLLNSMNPILKVPLLDQLETPVEMQGNRTGDAALLQQLMSSVGGQNGRNNFPADAHPPQNQAVSWGQAPQGYGPQLNTVEMNIRLLSCQVELLQLEHQKNMLLAMEQERQMSSNGYPQGYGPTYMGNLQSNQGGYSVQPPPPIAGARKEKSLSYSDASSVFSQRTTIASMAAGSSKSLMEQDLSGFSLSGPVDRLKSGSTTAKQAVEPKRRSTGTDSSMHGMFCLTRGARKQVNALLDEFWGRFYNTHGQSVSPVGSVMGSSSGTALYEASRQCAKAIMRVEGMSTMLPLSKIWVSSRRVSYPSLAPHEAIIAALVVEEGESFSQDWESAGIRVFLSFGVWSMALLIMLCHVETRPELWGKAAYVMNRLQGFMSESGLEVAPLIKSSAVLKDRMDPAHLMSLRQDMLHMLGVLEISVMERKGPHGTAAGDIAFPMGKEIMHSIIKRYRRKLGLGKGAQEASPATSATGMPLNKRIS